MHVRSLYTYVMQSVAVALSVAVCSIESMNTVYCMPLYEKCSILLLLVLKYPTNATKVLTTQ